MALWCKNNQVILNQCVIVFVNIKYPWYIVPLCLQCANMIDLAVDVTIDRLSHISQIHHRSYITDIFLYAECHCYHVENDGFFPQ